MPWKECSVMDERVRFVGRLLDGEKMVALCREFAISRKTGYKIFDRYKEYGLEALTDRSRRPWRYANQLPQQVEAAILNLKREKPYWGARKIRERLLRRFSCEVKVPARSTIHAVLDRHGLVQRRGRRRNHVQGTPLSLGQKPNELWCTDYKGEFLLGNHQYCYPLTVTGSYGRPRWCARASRSGCSSPPEREVGWHTERDVGSYRSVLVPRIPGSDRRSCSRFCGRFRTPCTVPPLARRLAGEPQTVAFHPSPNTPSTASLPPQKGKKCNLCVRYDLLPMSRVAHLFASIG